MLAGYAPFHSFHWTNFWLVQPHFLLVELVKHSETHFLLSWNPFDLFFNAAASISLDPRFPLVKCHFATAAPHRREVAPAHHSVAHARSRGPMEKPSEEPRFNPSKMMDAWDMKNVVYKGIIWNMWPINQPTGRSRNVDVFEYIINYIQLGLRCLVD